MTPNKKMTPEEVQRLWDDILRAAGKKAPKTDSKKGQPDKK